MCTNRGQHPHVALHKFQAMDDHMESKKMPLKIYIYMSVMSCLASISISLQKYFQGRLFFCHPKKTIQLHKWATLTLQGHCTQSSYDRKSKITCFTSLLETLLKDLLTVRALALSLASIIFGISHTVSWITFTCFVFLLLCCSCIQDHVWSLAYVSPNQQITINANSHFLHMCLQHLHATMNPVYSPASTGVPFTNTKGMGYPGKFEPVAASHKNRLSLDLLFFFLFFYCKLCFCRLFFTLAGFPVGYAAAAAPAYTPNVYAGANPAFPSGEFSLTPTEQLSIVIYLWCLAALTQSVFPPPGYAPGTPFKMSCSPNTGTVPPYSASPNPYPAAVYPVRSTYPQQNPYAQVWTQIQRFPEDGAAIRAPQFHLWRWLFSLKFCSQDVIFCNSDI